MKDNLLKIIDKWEDAIILYGTDREYAIDGNDIKVVLDAVIDLDRLNRYITALENCEVRSKTVINRLRTQTGMDAPPEGE